MKKIIILLLLISIQTSCFAQFKNYRIKNKSIDCEKSLSDISILNIIEEKKAVIIDENDEENDFSVSSDLTAFLVGKVSKIPEYITQYLKKRKLKFTAIYEAKNTLSFQSSKKILPRLEFQRYYFSKNNKKQNAFKLVLCPKLVQDNKYIAFNVESLYYKYSKAKVKKNAPRINLLVEITLHYSKTANESHTIEKTESKSSAIIIPASLDTETQNIDLINNKLSDVFIAEDISEISVKITEINPYKLKLEELEDFLTTNNEDLSGLFEELSKLLK